MEKNIMEEKIATGTYEYDSDIEVLEEDIAKAEEAMIAEIEAGQEE